MLGEIRAMQVYTMTRKNSKKYLHSTISYKYKIVLWKFFYAGSQIRAVQIRAMRNRASRGMTVFRPKKNYLQFFLSIFRNILIVLYGEKEIKQLDFLKSFLESLKAFDNE